MTTTLSPPAAPHRKLSGIEAGRGIAALMVVLYHTARHVKADYGALPWGGLTQSGHAGVDFFFVLSGFIIFFVHGEDVGRQSRLLHYAERRFARIYPMFWVALAIGLGLAALSSTQAVPSLPVIAERASLLPFAGDAGVAWTLQHEMLFYLIFACAIIDRRFGKIVLMMWSFLIVATWASGFPPSRFTAVERLASTYNLEFFLGMGAAHIVKQGQVGRAGGILAGGVALFAAFGLAETMGWFDGYAPSARLAYGGASMLIVIGIAAANRQGRLAMPALLTRLGAASYSIYLLHLPCIGVTYKLLGVTGMRVHLPPGVLTLVLVASGIAVPMVLSRLVEYPLMNAVHRAGRKAFHLVRPGTKVAQGA